MRTTLLFWMLALLATDSSAQVIDRPYVESVDDRLCYVNRIETTKNFTIITFEHKNNGTSVDINPAIYLEAPGNERYNFIKAEGIPVKPESHTFKEGEGPLTFKVYFQPLPKTVKTIDIHETEPRRGSFNFYGVSLSRSRTTDVQQPHSSENEIVLEQTASNDLNSVVSQITPMYSGIINAMMNSTIQYYKQPGKLAELAKLNKQYYDALLKEGFSTEQAMQIIVSNPLSKPAEIGK